MIPLTADEKAMRVPMNPDGKRRRCLGVPLAGGGACRARSLGITTVPLWAAVAACIMLLLAAAEGRAAKTSDAPDAIPQTSAADHGVPLPENGSTGAAFLLSTSARNDGKHVPGPAPVKTDDNGRALSQAAVQARDEAEDVSGKSDPPEVKPGTGPADDETVSASPSATAPAPAGFAAEWGGYLKSRGTVSFVDEDSFLGSVAAGEYYDGSLEGRLKGSIAWGRGWSFETHYEALLAGGDTTRRGRELPPALAAYLPTSAIDDSRRLFDLSKTISEGDSYTLSHRIDRLAVTFAGTRGLVRAGRQAVTWGGGMVFNPMDFLSPFVPTDIEREYKVGDDMLFVQARLPRGGDAQAVCVPRRDPASGTLREDQSTLAGELHTAFGTTEIDIMAAKHYGDIDAGIGATGYAGQAAWRVDLVLTVPDDKADRGAYLSAVANMDYSWVFGGKNWYGFIEFFFNGLGEDGDYGEAAVDPYVAERISRGDLFTLGRWYGAAHLRAEVHPLVNVLVTAIVNLRDPSGILLPRLTWDMTENTRLTLGGTWYFGAEGTEYGGFPVTVPASLPGAGTTGGTPASPPPSGTSFPPLPPGVTPPPVATALYKPADSVFLWIAYYF